MEDALPTMTKFMQVIYDGAALYLPKVALALLTLIVGFWIIGAILKGMRKGLDARQMDPSLGRFLASVIGVLLKLTLLVMVASMVGIQTTSLVALVGAAGLAVGLALQGTLANFAGGVLILMFKPFKVGDWIDAQGYSGTVNEIQIFQTVLKTPDNKTIIIPNGSLSNGNITNYSSEPLRRVDFNFGIGYGDDISKAKEVLLKIANADKRVLQDPSAPFAGVKEHGDSAVVITLRVWVDAGDYWGLYYDFMETVKVTFDAEGISIPYPQQDVHMHNVG
ncbi:MAG TPA: mechanosensitive ion channel [Bacteroidetes bacterium]|nr:small-conductance mechanosensitive channel [bacterium BMS3Bbin04]HDO65699.1 mechanosensitive ion channel [Bacteroidota bacterium]HEX04824.1 mechanosensitive ion channel [Bacteroidota bacterium]